MTRRNQPSRDPEQEHRAEAARLRCVDRDTQRQIIAIHRNTAENRKLPKQDRDFAGQRADALERILGPAPTGATLQGIALAASRRVCHESQALVEVLVSDLLQNATNNATKEFTK
jgi:hypothetical protein